MKLKPWQQSLGDMSRGAPMGIPNEYPENNEAPITLTVERCNWVDGDYLENGAYYGSGNGDDWIYCAYGDDCVLYWRAKSREEAEAHFKSELPNATFTASADVVDWRDFDTFTRAYIVAALWESGDEHYNKKREAKEAGYVVVDNSLTDKSLRYTFVAEDEDPQWLTRSYDYEQDAWDAAFEDMGGGSCDSALDTYFTADDIAPETLLEMQKDCLQFQRDNAADLALAYESYRDITNGVEAARHAGHDFWLTRVRSGCGYWDGDLPEALGERLTEAAKQYNEFARPYVGDDEKIRME